MSCNTGFDGEDHSRSPRGAAVQHEVTETGVADRPRDLSAASFQRVAARDGARWLDIALAGDRTLVRDDGPNDVSTYRFGRGDAQFPAANSDVELDISGLSDWQAPDGVQIVSPNVGLVLAGPETELAAPSALGATAIRGRLDWKTTFAPMVDAARGDTTWVTQMAGAGSGGLPYRRLARAGIARGFTVRDGGGATLSATLAAVPPDRELACT